jgi:hypothetical protein
MKRKRPTLRYDDRLLGAAPFLPLHLSQNNKEGRGRCRSSAFSYAQHPMLLSASYAKMPFSTGISPFPYGCRIRAAGGFKAPPSLIRKKGMDKNVSKPGKRHDFPGFSYCRSRRKPV